MCIQDFTAPCPLDWTVTYGSDPKLKCEAPEGYSGICKNEIIMDLDGSTIHDRMLLGSDCNVQWPCKDQCTTIETWDVSNGQVCPNGYSLTNNLYCAADLIIMGSYVLCKSVASIYTTPLEKIYQESRKCALNWTCRYPDALRKPARIENRYLDLCPIGYTRITDRSILCGRNDLSINELPALMAESIASLMACLVSNNCDHTHQIPVISSFYLPMKTKIQLLSSSKTTKIHFESSNICPLFNENRSLDTTPSCYDSKWCCESQPDDCYSPFTDDSLSSAFDWDSPCPSGWKYDGESCNVPPDYEGMCKLESIKTNNWSHIHKQLFASFCESKWLCYGDILPTIVKPRNENNFRGAIGDVYRPIQRHISGTGNANPFYEMDTTSSEEIKSICADVLAGAVSPTNGYVPNRLRVYRHTGELLDTDAHRWCLKLEEDKNASKDSSEKKANRDLADHTAIDLNIQDDNIDELPEIDKFINLWKLNFGS